MYGKKRALNCAKSETSILSQRLSRNIAPHRVSTTATVSPLISAQFAVGATSCRHVVVSPRFRNYRGELLLSHKQYVRAIVVRLTRIFRLVCAALLIFPVLAASLRPYS